MGVFPEIEELVAIPDFHLKYAEAILETIIAKLLAEEEIDVGIFFEKEGEEKCEGSIISFSTDEFENVFVHLRYHSGKYEVKVEDHTSDFNTSIFVYDLRDSGLEGIIPSVLREFMEKVALENQHAIFRPGTLDQ